MRRQGIVLPVAASLLFVAAWHPGPIARANGGMPTPIPPPGGTPHPIRPFLGSEAVGAPYDFHFSHFNLFGEFFQPGEQVTITTEHLSLPATTVTANSNGQFNAFVDFNWQFCGPGATAQPAPIFHAVGTDGSTDTLTLLTPSCPLLVASRPVPPAPLEPGGTPGGAAGTGAVVATAVPAPTAVPGPPQGQPTPSTPQPARAMVLTYNLVQGFGFRPGEQVTIRETNVAGAAPSLAVVTADALGRIQTTLFVSVPGPCSSAPQPKLVAMGDRGTSASASPVYAPMPMYPCVGPPPTATVTPTAVSHPTHLSVTLRPRVARPGRQERADVRTGSAGTMQLAVRYPHGGAARWTVGVGSSGRVEVRWRIPLGVRSGTASLRVTFNPGHVALRTAFQVR